jgi:hypothetical protein
MKRAIVKLLDLKSIITLLLVLTLVYLVWTEKDIPEKFITFMSIIITYYFTRKNGDDEKKGGSGDD